MNPHLRMLQTRLSQLIRKKNKHLSKLRTGSGNGSRFFRLGLGDRTLPAYLRVKRELLASRYKIQFLATGDTAIPCLLTFLIIARKNSPNKILLFPARNTAVVHKSREFRLRFSYLLHETPLPCTKVENPVNNKNQTRKSCLRV